jgi:hypothetical protein
MTTRLAPLGRSLLPVLVAACLVPAALAAQARPGQPEPGSELTVYLMTMGPGELVWERFGHNALYIRDEIRGTDLAYNYGLFDFSEEDFLPRFIQGRMRYWMEGADAGRTAQVYAMYDRSVWLQELNLTPAQRLELREFLEWNEREENRYYRYDYYYDNCSTRVRDAIDLVLGGAIRTQTEGVPAGTTFRWHTRRLAADDILMYTGLNVGLGRPVDRPISVWEEMFLPMAVREHLRGVEVALPDGTSAPLVRSEVTLHASSTFLERDAPPRRLAGYLVLGVLLAAALVAMAMRAHRSRTALESASVLMGAWGLVAGLLGLLLAVLWLFTDHQAAHFNENLLQLSPLHLPLAVLGPFALRARPRGFAAARALGLLVAATSLVGLLLHLLPVASQANGEIVALALPLNLAVAWVLVRRGLEHGGGLPPAESSRSAGRERDLTEAA